MGSGNSTSGSPDRGTADNTFCAFILFFQGMFEGSNELAFIHVPIGFNGHFCKFFVNVNEYLSQVLANI